jgi:hypothetical protein
MDLKTRLTLLLATVFGDNDGARMVSTHAGLSLQNIDFEGTAAEVWTRVIEQAVVQKRIENLIEYAREQYSGNDTFREAADALSRNPRAFDPPPPGLPGEESRWQVRRQVWIWITVAVLVAIATVYYIVPRSHTEISIRDRPDLTYIYINIRNTGQRPSTLQSYKLQFRTGLREAALDLASNEIPQIPPGTDKKLGLTTPELVLYRTDGRLYTKDDLWEDLKKNEFKKMQVILLVDVKEWQDRSSREPRRIETSIEFIQEFLLGRMSG